MENAADAPAEGFSPTVALVRIAREAELELARVLEPRGLTVRKLAVLERIVATPGLSAAALARALRVATAEAERLVTGLTAAGLVRTAGPAGAHAPQLAATESGGRVLADATRAIAEIDERLFASGDLAAVAAALRQATHRAPVAPHD